MKAMPYSKYAKCSQSLQSKIPSEYAAHLHCIKTPHLAKELLVGIDKVFLRRNGTLKGLFLGELGPHKH